MDERIESFMELVRTLEGAPHVGEAVRVWLAAYEDQFPDIKRASCLQRICRTEIRRSNLLGFRRFLPNSVFEQCLCPRTDHRCQCAHGSSLGALAVDGGRPGHR
jgi:hypothetical protein